LAPNGHRVRQNRRKLLKAAGLTAASTVVSAPVIAQSAPVLRWAANAKASVTEQIQDDGESRD